MTLTVSRRSVLAGAAALPFLRMSGARAATPGTLTFGLSSYPPNILPWANTGTAAATIKLMIYRGLTGFAPDGSLRGELAESWSAGGKQGLGLQVARRDVPERREGHERRREVDHRAGRRREIDRLSARADAEHRQGRDARRQDRALRDEGAGRDVAAAVRQLPHADHLARLRCKVAGRRRTVHDQGAGARRFDRTRGVAEILQAWPAQAEGDPRHRLCGREPARGGPAGGRCRSYRIRAMAVHGGHRQGRQADARRRRRAVHVPHLQRHQAAVQRRARAQGGRPRRQAR